MSLPTYLASIKSSGIYRFVWDKSQVPPQTAETMRLVVGYSEKGPFNTPTYCENASDFIAAYGNISKRLERKGCFFHRSALAALGAGPILALNLKPFEDESVSATNFNFSTGIPIDLDNSDVVDIYDTAKFWTLDADTLPTALKASNYAILTATDSKETSCSVFMRGIKPAQYDITIREWYANSSEEMPEYLEPIQDKKLSDYFVDVYVFRGQFTEDICKVGAPFGNSAAGKQDGYFVVEGTGDDAKIKINSDYEDAFGQVADALDALANDPSSQYLGHYTGCTLPYFKDGNGNYISIDILVNGDYLSHKLLMKLDESKLESFDIPEGSSADKELDKMLKFADSLTIVSNEDTSGNFNGTYAYPDIAPTYFQGYDYTTIGKKDTGAVLQDKIFKVFDYIGIRKALTSRVDVEYHYIVDTFATYAGSRNKSKIALIAKEKDNAFALLNYPFISEYKSDDKYMVEKEGKKYLDFSKVVAIDNILPSKANGASWCAFFTGVVISDGTLKSTCPACGYISNLFMEKWGPRHPYDAVAGPNFGVISADGLVGPDYAFSRADLDVLEPYGVNCLVYRPRIGTYINSNQTAQQVPVTALSKINVRELVIYLQNEIETMLQGYHWELNTQALRDTIKAKADSILGNVQQNGGIYAFKNVCDETNNTPEVIDNEMLILSSEIEPSRPSGRIVQELTIHRTGGLTQVSTNS